MTEEEKKILNETTGKEFTVEEIEHSKRIQKSVEFIKKSGVKVLTRNGLT